MLPYDPHRLGRRDLLRLVATSLGLGSAGPAFARVGTEALPAIRAITRGPKFHWFGYYDKLEFDPTGRYVLGMEVDFEHRSPRPDDVIKVGMVDLHDGDRWIELGESRAWSWQQGCMLQWLPGSKTEVIWNDREGGRFVCRILDVDDASDADAPRAHLRRQPRRPTGRSRPTSAACTTSAPATATPASPTRTATSPRPRTPASGGSTCATGRTELLFSIRQIAALPYLEGEPARGQALVQSPALRARRLAVRLPAPLARGGPRGAASRPA